MSVPSVQPPRVVPPAAHSTAIAPPSSTCPAHIPDVLVSSCSSCTGWLYEIGSQIMNFFKNVWAWICGFCCACSSTSSAAPVALVPSHASHQITNPNKLYVYHQLTQGRAISSDPITAQKFALDPAALENLPLFGHPEPNVSLVNGPFRYDSSTADTIYWTANFADSNLFGFCEGPLLAQDELQVLEHPALAHLKHALPSDQRTLNPYEVALFQNVPRLGALDTSTPLPNGQTLYGNYFANANQAEILSRLTRFSNPTKSNIFAIAAPHISSALNGQLYTRRNLELLFFTFHNALKRIKETCPGKKVVIDMGNWGMGAFGNGGKAVYLALLAAAHFTQADTIRMHPLSRVGEFHAAKQLLAQIKAGFPQITVGQFLDHSTQNAAAYNLRYGLGNGT